MFISAICSPWGRCTTTLLYPPGELASVFINFPKSLRLLLGFYLSLKKVMKERLLFAAFNCSAIDGDDNFAGMNAAALGWDWDEDEEGEDGA